MDATEITAYWTNAAAAIASKYLAREIRIRLGLAVENIAETRLLFEQAKEAGGYPSIDLVRT